LLNLVETLTYKINTRIDCPVWYVDDLTQWINWWQLANGGRSSKNIDL